MGQLGEEEAAGLEDGIPRSTEACNWSESLRLLGKYSKIRCPSLPLSLSLEEEIELSSRNGRGVLTEVEDHRCIAGERTRSRLGGGGGGTFPRVNAIKRWSSGGAICPEQQAEKLSLCTSGIISRG